MRIVDRESKSHWFVLESVNLYLNLFGFPNVSRREEGGEPKVWSQRDRSNLLPISRFCITVRPRKTRGVRGGATPPGITNSEVCRKLTLDNFKSCSSSNLNNLVHKSCRKLTLNNFKSCPNSNLNNFAKSGKLSKFELKQLREIRKKLLLFGPSPRPTGPTLHRTVVGSYRSTTPKSCSGFVLLNFPTLRPCPLV